MKGPRISRRASGAPGRPYRQLKPHPGSAGDAVCAHQLGRIHAATIDIVAEGGYRALTVEAVARAAGISKLTFYQHFAGKEECFLATYDLIVREMIRGVLAAQGGDPDRVERLRRGCEACARQIAESPRAARLALVDIYVDVEGAKERLRHSSGLLEALIARSFTSAPDGVELPEQIYRAIVGACTALARARLLGGEGERFRAEAGELAAWALSLRDPAAAVAFATPTALVSSPPRGGGDLAAIGGCDGGPAPDRDAVLMRAAEIAASEGYEAVTAERVGRELGIAKVHVTPQLPNREECLVAALEEHGRRAIGEVRAAFSAQAGWPRAVAAGLTALCARLEVDEALARLGLDGVFEAGPAVTAWRSEKHRGLAALLRATASPKTRPTRLQAEASVAGIWAVLAAARQRDGGEGLRGLAPGLAYIVLAPVIGPQEAAAAIRESGAGAVDAREETSGPPEDAAAGGRRDRDADEKEPVPGC